MANPAGLRLSGAVDLSRLAAPSAPAAAGASVAPDGSAVIDVTEASFETDVLARSSTVPVVIDFWADWCGPCKQLSPVLEKLAAESAGAWVLAKIDVDANPRLAQAAQVQGIPAVKAVVNGQLVSEFTGALPEAQVRQWITQVLQAARNGTFGPMNGAAPPEGEDAAAPLDPDLDAGDEALVGGDLDAAAAAYQRVADRLGAPADLRAEGTAGLARVALLRRAESLDPQDVQDRLGRDPADLEAALAMADLLVLADRSGDAFTLLLDVVRSSAGDTRDAARTRLVQLFEAVASQDPELVAKARRELATALF